MKQYRLIDNVLGGVTFLIAAFVYCSTIEPTASFWDCPEFITTGYKLEVGHPPGAPFFMLTANLFTQFVSDPSDVARMVNTMSALLSATCILFLFWTITHLVRRLLIDNWDELTTSKTIAIEASGLVGALIYTFSDTFWFSAVEGEVYAYSSAFTAVVNRCSPLEPALYSCHRTCILLQALSRCRPQGFTHRLVNKYRYRSSSTLWRCTRYHNRWRLVRVVLCEHPRNAIQHRRDYLYRSAYRRCGMGYLRELC